ncbi:hypothetical protein [Streptomyces hygroscopicus]|uniref:hypothetical protein n=1 Tax=Streptomyces hygroscopicus TaxID=1912 RepID=UPI00099EBDD1|nr:hypothetical protein [Streptomyces hygroscopicus]
MASIVERPKRDGATTFQVKWRQDGEWQTEKFGDRDSADPGPDDSDRPCTGPAPSLIFAPSRLRPGGGAFACSTLPA